MDKVKIFFSLLYTCLAHFFLVCLLFILCVKTAFCFDDANYYEEFLISQIMVLKIREFREEFSAPENYEAIFNEAKEKGVTLPAWVNVDPAKKNSNIEKNEVRRERAGELDSIILAASKRYRLPQSLIRAVIKAESNFDPGALSSKGAQGLMQLMPETANSIGVKDAFDARENVLGGSFLLKKYINTYGSLKKTLIAYNAGPGWIHKDMIPAETQDYIRRVITCFKYYQDVN